MRSLVVVKSVFGNTRRIAEAIGEGLTGETVAAAAFDTRVVRPRTPGALLGAAWRLRRRGFRLVAKLETFRVTGSRGPLTEGEMTVPGRGEALAARIAGQEQVGPPGR